jgi:hypothetical protein
LNRRLLTQLFVTPCPVCRRIEKIELVYHRHGYRPFFVRRDKARSILRG